MTSLFDPLQAGAFMLKNRVVLAPLTRCRSSAGRVPNDLMREYYVQRASAGLMLIGSNLRLGDGRRISRYSGHLVGGASRGLEAHHRSRARGRRHHSAAALACRPHLRPDYLGRRAPVAPSAIAPKGHVSLMRPMRDYVVPRALDLSEIPGIVAEYRRGAENAKRAGFDGVEVHGANGYLLDQFLQDGTNLRTDAYGGPIENRARLMLEVVDACIEVWGADRVGLHLAPRGDSHTMGDSNPLATFGYVAEQMGQARNSHSSSRASAKDQNGSARN